MQKTLYSPFPFPPVMPSTQGYQPTITRKMSYKQWLNIVLNICLQVSFQTYHFCFLFLLRFNFSKWICLFGAGQRDGSISIDGTWTHDFRLDRAALANWTATPKKVSYIKITINLFNYLCATPNHLFCFRFYRKIVCGGFEFYHLWFSLFKFCFSPSFYTSLRLFLISFVISILPE